MSKTYFPSTLFPLLTLLAASPLIGATISINMVESTIFRQNATLEELPTIALLTFAEIEEDADILGAAAFELGVGNLPESREKTTTFDHPALKKSSLEIITTPSKKQTSEPFLLPETPLEAIFMK